MSDTLPSKHTITQERLNTLLCGESGKDMLRKMVELNPFMEDLLLSDKPATITEDFAMLTYAAATTEIERELHEILATKDGINGMRGLLEEDRRLAHSLQFVALNHIPDDDDSFSSPWL